MSELSPAAFAVVDAFVCAHARKSGPSSNADIAAALRAAADQVVPDQGDIWTRDLRGDAWIRWEERKLIRRDLLSIADELDAQ